MTIQELRQGYKEGAWGVVFTGLVGGEGRQSEAAEVMDIESHGPATTIKVIWHGGSSYSGLLISVDLTLALEYAISNLPVALSDKLPQTVASGYLEKAGFHVVPVGFDMWRISFSTVERHLLSDTPDEFKACYRVLKYVRDIAADDLDVDASLVPSYIFKSVLLSRYFAAGAESKEKEYWLQQVEDTLDAVLKGIMHGDIQNFFLSGYNLLSTTDHKNKSRQFIVENMLSLVKGLKMTPHTQREVRETTRQIRVLEVVDALEFLLSEAFARKDLTALWNKLFVNIDDVPTGAWDDVGTKFYDQITDLDRLDLDEEVYVKLVREWDAFQYVFIQLTDYLPEEEKSLALKFFIKTWDKRKKFEREHHGDVVNPVKITVHEAACQYIMETVTDYIDERGYIGKLFSNLLKALPRDYTSPGFLSDVAAITWKEGSDRGSAVFKERLKECMSGFSQSRQSVLTSVIVGYVSQFFLHAKEGLRRKLDYIEITELDLD